MTPARAHVIVPTHTTRHLGLCLAALGRQSPAPATVVVTVDGDVPAIGELARDVWRRLAAQGLRGLPRLAVAMRAHTGEARLNQVRNNGLRALEGLGALPDDDLIVTLDGDTMLAPDAIGRHLALVGARGGAEVIIPYRVNLAEDVTARLSLEDALGGRIDIAGLVTGADRAALRARARRYRRQLLLKRVAPGLVKAHKPKVLGGHHAVRAGALRRVNGYDEQYVGFGFDDDDLTKRLHRLRPRVAIAVEEILAAHLWHAPSAASGWSSQVSSGRARPEDAPGAARFARRDLPTRAERGWDSPAEQPNVRVEGGMGSQPMQLPQGP